MAVRFSYESPEGVSLISSMCRVLLSPGKARSLRSSSAGDGQVVTWEDGEAGI